jgi:hypothetical protein
MDEDSHRLRKIYNVWNPSVGESITGRILFFDRDDESFMAFLKIEDTFILIPVEACEVFSHAKPEDGSEITITFTEKGYQWSQKK